MMLQLKKVVFKHLYQSLSGGEKTRLSVARALSSPASVLIFDEPTSGLDPETVSEIEQLILSIEGKTIFVSTHNWDKEYLSKFDEVIKVSAEERILNI